MLKLKVIILVISLLPLTSTAGLISKIGGSDFYTLNLSAYSSKQNNAENRKAFAGEIISSTSIFTNKISSLTPKEEQWLNKEKSRLEKSKGTNDYSRLAINLMNSEITSRNDIFLWEKDVHEKAKCVISARNAQVESSCLLELAIILNSFPRNQFKNLESKGIVTSQELQKVGITEYTKNITPYKAIIWEVIFKYYLLNHLTS